MCDRCGKTKPAKPGTVKIISVDQSLIDYAKQRAEEKMLETQDFIAYSPPSDHPATRPKKENG